MKPPELLYAIVDKNGDIRTDSIEFGAPNLERLKRLDRLIPEKAPHVFCAYRLQGTL